LLYILPSFNRHPFHKYFSHHKLYSNPYRASIPSFHIQNAFTYPIQLISLLTLLLLGQHTEAAGYCNTVTREKVLLQSGDYVYVYWIDAPAYSGGGSITENCIMNNGAAGSGVRTLQTTLNQCHSEGLATDGKYGDKTKAAVKRVCRLQVKYYDSLKCILRLRLGPKEVQD
jgi:hypothetical protein